MIRAALAIITNTKGEILLQHRDEKAPTNPDKWGLWGGGIEKGETPVQALVRELKEELAIDVLKDELIPFKTYRERHFGDDWEGYVFNLQDKGNFTYVLLEGKDLRFYSQDEIKRLDTDPITSPILEDFFSL